MGNSKEHSKTVQNSRNRTETGQKLTVRLPRTHQDYWFSRLRRRSYVHDGKRTVVPTWQVRIQYQHIEEWFNLETANQAEASRKARDIWVHLVANGWAPTIAKFKPKAAAKAPSALTVGRFLEAVRESGYLRLRTFLNYQNCFRTILSEVFGIKAGAGRFDYRAGGNQKWLERIDSVRLQRITPDQIAGWQRARVARAGHSPAAIASAKRTANSYVRCARSLFSGEILKRLKGVSVPCMPFAGVELFESGSVKYVSKVDVRALIASARKDLKVQEPEVYKAFLLGLFAGMRKGEIDLVEWRMIDFGAHVIRLEETEWLHLKTQDSAAAIMVDEDLTRELRAMIPPPTAKSTVGGQFVIACDRPPRNDSARVYYRCEPLFDRLTTWLRGKGVSSNKPLHELRKEVGALVATEHGIYAASRFLRHSDITTTARHYADQKDRITAGLGKFLAAPKKKQSAARRRQKAV